MKNIKMIKTLTALIFSLPVLVHAHSTDTIVAHHEYAEEKTSEKKYFDDSAITAKIKKNLLGSKSDLKGLTVTTNSGIVHLTGFVSSVEKKVLATRLAQQVKGVKSVENNIVINKDNSTVKSYASDSAITTAIKAKLLADTAISTSDIQVITKNNVVLLTGTVPDQIEMDKAIKVIKEIDGVKNIKNQLRIEK